MKKSSFLSMVLGTISGVFFALGMCMTLIAEWNSFRQGLVFAGVGILLGLITVIIWRKMENKAPIQISAKKVLSVIIGVVGATVLGVGMCFSMVWNNVVLGSIIGVLRILVLLSLIPFTKGLE